MWLRASLVFLLALGAGAASANSTLTLERWLERDAAPKLAKQLSAHPRFKGEVVRLSAMQSGHLTATSNRLVASIERELTLLLNKHPNVRLRWAGQPQRPSDPAVHYVLGIEAQRLGSGRYEVTLAMVDLSEGIWVGGTATRWKGRLNQRERKLLAQHVTVPNPVPARAVPTPGAPAAVAITPAPLLAPITARSVRREGICDTPRIRRCLEFEVTLAQPATLLVFSTADGAVRGACEAARPRDAGSYRFRVPVRGDRPTRQSIGFYAVATHDAAVSEAIGTSLSAAPGGCHAQADGTWLANLTQTLDQHAGAYQWQALHQE